MSNEHLPEQRVVLIGGPLDGWPIVIRGRLPTELRLPYSRAMLELAARTPDPELRQQWDETRFPSERDADGVALYRHKVADGEPRSSQAEYTFVGMSAGDD